MDPRKLRRMALPARLFSLRVLRSLSGQQTVFPFYHVVSDRELAHLKHLYPYKSEWQFERDLELLLRYFEPISVEDYLESPQPGKGKARMVLSFDDGLVECHRYIAPLLQRKGIPAIFYLNNDFIDNRGLFYRYKASVLVEHLRQRRTDRCVLSDFMAIPEEQVQEAVLMISYRQLPLLDALMEQVELDDALYMRDHPVYMSTEQVNDLLQWGFHIGGHSADHPEFYRMEEKKMAASVAHSIHNLKENFKVRHSLFAFPFTSDGVPRRVIMEILEEGIADLLMGTAGLKKTGDPRFVQRIPMEQDDLSAGTLLRAEYLSYLLKAPLGKNLYYKVRRE